MIYNKEEFKNKYEKYDYINVSLEKVLRLIDILEIINNDVVLKDKLALKGGTAINLMAGMPRLSVDIDLDYAKNIDKDEISKEKENLKIRINKLLVEMGYEIVSSTREYFALSSFFFSYINSGGNKDYIKIDINYLDRAHVYPLAHVKPKLEFVDIKFNILMLNKTEMYASKINALMSRNSTKDLFDVWQMIETHQIEDIDGLKKTLIYYNMIGGDQNIDYYNVDIIKKIDYYKVKTTLKPMLHKRFNIKLDEIKNTVIDFMNTILILDKNDVEFINLFRNGIYKPELLFKNYQILDAIENHPMALWRLKKTS